MGRGSFRDISDGAPADGRAVRPPTTTREPIDARVLVGASTRSPVVAWLLDGATTCEDQASR